MRRVALTFAAALAATAVMAPAASAQYHGPGGVHRGYRAPAHVGMHRTYRGLAVRSTRLWAGPRVAYRAGYRSAALHRAYRYRPYGVSVAGATIAAGALYGTAYTSPYDAYYGTGYESPYYGGGYDGSVYSGGGLVAYPYPTYSVGYAGYAGYGAYGYGGGCYTSCRPVIYYRSCGCSAGW